MGSMQASNYDVRQTQPYGGLQPGTANSWAAQQHFADGRQIKLRDARGTSFEPQTSYINHYPEKVQAWPVLSSTVSHLGSIIFACKSR